MQKTILSALSTSKISCNCRPTEANRLLKEKKSSFSAKARSGRVPSLTQMMIEILNSEMDRLAKERSKEMTKLKSEQAAKSLVPANSKRRVSSTTFYGKSSKSSDVPSKKKKVSEAPKMTEEEKTRLRILELNKKESEKRSNMSIISKSKKSKDPDDADWTPELDDRSMDSEIYNQFTHDSKIQKKRNELVHRLVDGSDSDEDGVNSRSHSPTKADGDDKVSQSPPSPSKEDLKKQLELLRKQLEGKGSTSSNQSVNKKGDSRSSSPPKDRMDSTEKDLHRSPSDNDSSFNEEKKPEQDSGDLEQYEGKSSKSSRKNEKADKADDIDLGELVSLSNEDYSSLEHQLYGPCNDTKELCYGIFIKTNDLTSALTGSTNVNHLFRRLMAGVFNPAEILGCTVTGQSWHAGGTEHRSVKQEPLHPKALKAIVDFSNSVAKSKKWPRKGMDKAKTILAIKLTEIKTAFRNKSKKE